MSNLRRKVFAGLEVLVGITGCSGNDTCIHCAAARDLKKARAIVKHARGIYIDGQLDKYPSTDASDEYKLWRLVKKENEE